MNRLPRIIFVLGLLLCTPLAQAQTVWANGTVAGLPFSARVAIGAGLELPADLFAVGLEVFYGYTPAGGTRGGALVVRDVGIPFTSLSLRGELGLEQSAVAGTFDQAPWVVFAGVGLRYVLAGPLGLIAGARTYINGPTIYFSLGLDTRL